MASLPYTKFKHHAEAWKKYNVAKTTKLKTKLKPSNRWSFALVQFPMPRNEYVFIPEHICIKFPILFWTICEGWLHLPLDLDISASIYCFLNSVLQIWDGQTFEKFELRKYFLKFPCE